MKLVFSKATRRRSINEMRASGSLDTAKAEALAKHMNVLGL
jgi:Spy/CpxP family protein refolding chaperone